MPNGGDTVIGDASDRKSLLLELFEGIVQLHQLILAVGSPVSGAIETDDQASRTLQRIKITPIAVLVLSANGRNRLSHPDPNFLEHIGPVKVALTQGGFQCKERQCKQQADFRNPRLSGSHFIPQSGSSSPQ
jgi:hypothetical protein